MDKLHKIFISRWSFDASPLLNYEGMSIFCNHMSLLVWKASLLMDKLHKVFS